MQPLDFEVVEGDRVVAITVRVPDSSLNHQAEKVYRRALQKAVSAGRPPRRKVLDRIDAMWGPAEQAKHEELCVARAADEALLTDGALSVEDRRAVAERLRQSRAAWRQLFAAINALELQTAEVVAQQAEFDFLVAACTHHRSGAKYFENVETYIALRGQGNPVAHKAYWALAGELYGLREDYEETLPESVVLGHHSLSC